MLVLIPLSLVVFTWGRGEMLRTARHMRDSLIDNPYFSVSEIQVRGGEKVGGAEVMAMAGLKRGMSIWKIDAANIERKVRRIPWVREVHVRREFPRRVVIEVAERVPKAILAMGKLYYVDSEGIVFKEVEAGEEVRFPLFTGLRREELTRQDPALRLALQEAVRLSELLHRNSLPLSEIRFQSRNRVLLYPLNHSVALSMGWGDWETKIERLERVLAMWKGKEDRLAALDLSFRDQVVAKLRGAGN